MSLRLLAAHRICSERSYQGIGRIARTRVSIFPRREWRPLLRTPGTVPKPRPIASSASPAKSVQFSQEDPAEDAESQHLSPYDLTDAASLKEHYEGILLHYAESGFLDEDGFARWRELRDVDDNIDENIIAVVDRFESITSFEDTEDSPRLPPITYWTALSHLLRFAYKSGNSRAQHALDTYRYRAREFMGAFSEASADPADRTVLLSTLIGCIANSPHDTLRVLSSHLEVPFYARADCCYHLRYIPDRWAEIQDDPELHRLYRQSLEVLRDRTLWKSIPDLLPRHMDLMRESLPRQEALKLLSDWQTAFPVLRDSDAIWLVNTYVELRDIDNAVKALRKVTSKLLRNPNDAILKTCVNLLRSDVVEAHGTSHAFRVLPSILELGLPPSDLIQNMVVQNTAKSGMVGVAFDLYESLAAQDIPIHGHTVTTLLKQSLQRGDIQVMDKLMSQVQGREDLSRNPYVMAVMMNIVRHIAHWKRKLGPEQCLSYLLAIYDRAYNREPLAQVGIIQPNQVQAGDFSLPSPHPVALQNFISSFVLMQEQESRVHEVWNSIVGVLNGKDQQLIDILLEPRTSPFFHAFLLFYQRSPFTLDAMLGVLQYMLKAHPELVEVPAWAIVVGGFLRHGQDETVKFVQGLMRLSARQAHTPGHARRLEAWLERRPAKAELVAYVKGLEADALCETWPELSEERKA